MRNSFITEILIIFLSALTGIIGWSIDTWWISYPVYVVGFMICSMFIGNLKRQTIEELQEKFKLTLKDTNKKQGGKK